MRSSVVESQTSHGIGTRGSSNAPRPDLRPPYPQRQTPKPPVRNTKKSFMLVPAEGWLALVLLAVVMLLNIGIRSLTGKQALLASRAE